MAAPATEPAPSALGLVHRVVRLAATPWVTPERIRRTIATLLAQGADPTAAQVITALERAATGGRTLADTLRVQAAADRLQAAQASVLIVGHPGYPLRLQDAWPELGAPLWVFARAPSAALPTAPAAAIVGTRQPTLDGTRTARDLAALLARAGVTVVSGMARGIDQAAHSGALHAGGRTVGVLGTGFGVDYPRGDGGLREAIAASGGLVTELLPGAPPRRPTFLWRNRIISALADVTVVVEGREGSGALHTARMAAAQGRDVLAVPGPVRAATSRAPLDLIRDGAQPLTRLEDVLDVLGLAVPEQGSTIQPPLPPAGVSPVAAALLPLLGAVPAMPGALAAAMRQSMPAVLAAVAELTGRGLASATPRGIVRGDAPP